MSRYFIDTEFIEGFHKPLFGKKRHFIDLVSIGIVAEDGREYYAISTDFNRSDADDWVKENVLDVLELESHLWKSEARIKEDLLQFFGCRQDEHFWRVGKDVPEVYGYYADYDWVVFCALFGRMIDLPKGFPMYCRDLKQIYDEKNHWWKNEVNRSLSVTNLRDTLDYPKQDNEHNALDDAKWNKALYDFLIKL